MAVVELEGVVEHMVLVAFVVPSVEVHSKGFRQEDWIDETHERIWQ